MISISFEGFDFRSAGQRLHEQVRQRAERAVNAAVEMGRARLQDRAPVKSGELRRSVVARPVSSTTSSVSADLIVGARYASFVSDGTKPHLIQARRARYLHFFVGGREVFTKRVRHPGTKPNDFWRNVAGSWDGRSKGALAEYLEAAMERAAEDAVKAVS